MQNPKIWLDFLLGNEVWKCLCVLCVIITPRGTLCRRVALKNKKHKKHKKKERDATNAKWRQSVM